MSPKNILERVIALEAKDAYISNTDMIKLKSKIERLEKIMESMGYYIP